MSGRVRNIPRNRYTTFWRRAVELQAASEVELEAGRFSAAVLDAVHAAISALDALCVHSLGQRTAGPDHREVLTLVSQLGDRSFPENSRRLQALLDLRTHAAYEDRLVTGDEAKDAVRAADRLMNWARRLLPSDAPR